MAVDAKAKGKDKGTDLVTYIIESRDEAKDAKFDRMQLNRDNFEMYQLKHDFSHKEEGQSIEVLPKVRMAVEQIKAFFQQALADITDWFSISIKDPSISEDSLAIKPHEAAKMLAYQHKKTHYFSHVGNAVQSGLLGALIITKTDSKFVPKTKFEVKTTGKGKSFAKHVVKVEDKTWQLKPCTVRQEDYYPDPTGAGLYEIEKMTVDLHEVIAKSKGDDAIYDPEMVSQLSRAMQEDPLDQWEKRRETGQNTTTIGHRPKVRLLEYWGSVVNSDGEIEYENIVMTLANDKWLIRKPTPNPLWHQKSPYVAAPIVEVANSVWPVALMDAPTKLARTIIELYNLMLDAAFKRVHAISQIRVADLVDQNQVSDGIKPGTKLLVKSTLPHNAKVMEKLEESDIPADAMNILNVQQQEFNAAALTSDLRQGTISPRAVKATEVVEQSQAISSIFQGMSKNVECKYIESEIELQWMTIAQNWDLISKEEKIALYGTQRGTELSQLAPQDVFVSTINGFKFSVHGITQTLSKVQDFQKLTQMLQTISNSDVLIEEFMKKFSFEKFLGEIMTSLNIDKHKIELDQPAPQAQLPGPEGPAAPQSGQQQNAEAPSAPNLADVFGGGIDAQLGGGPQ